MMTRIAVQMSVMGTLLLAAPVAVAAQEVSGRVMDADSGEGLRTAFVEVLDPDLVRVGAALTDGSGRFRVTLEDEVTGSFRVVINSLSHRSVTLDSIQVVAGELTDVGEIYVEEVPIALPGIVVAGRRSRITLGQEAIRRHQLLGQGTFLPGAMIEADNPNSLTDYLGQASGLWVRYRELGAGVLRNPESTTGYECVIVMVNRWPLNRPGLEPGDPPLGFPSLDNIPLDWIAGVEIFNDYNDVPDLYGSDAIAGGESGIPAYCGFVNVWTWNSWR